MAHVSPPLEFTDQDLEGSWRDSPWCSQVGCSGSSNAVIVVGCFHFTQVLSKPCAFSFGVDLALKYSKVFVQEGN